MKDPMLNLFYCYRDEENDGMKLEKRRVQRRLEARGIKYKSLYLGSDGTCCLNLSGSIITDLAPLEKIPLTHLCLQGCFGIKDFSPLKNMELTWLNLTRTNIKDLTHLSGLPLSYLRLYWTWTSDLSPLKEIPLQRLDIRFTKITDLSPLKYLPLKELFFFPSRIKKGCRALRGIKTLTNINRRSAEHFWSCHSRLL